MFSKDKSEKKKLEITKLTIQYCAPLNVTIIVLMVYFYIHWLLILVQLAN